MVLNFDVEFAQQFGLDEAIFCQQLAYWIHKNKANKVNKKDGRYWAYSSRRALSIMYPFWSPRVIDRVVSSCESKGLLIRTHPDGPTAKTWYSLTDLACNLLDFDLSPNGDNLSPNGDSLSPNGDSLSPNGDSDTNYNIKNIIKKEEKKKETFSKADAFKILSEAVGDDAGLRELIHDFIDLRWKLGKPYKTANGPTGAANRLRQYSDGDRTIMRLIIERTIESEWLTFYPPKEEDLPARDEQTRAPYREASEWR